MKLTDAFMQKFYHRIAFLTKTEYLSENAAKMGALNQISELDSAGKKNQKKKGCLETTIPYKSRCNQKRKTVFDDKSHQF